MDKKLYQRILMMVPLLRGLTPDELEEIVAISKLLKVRKDVTVVEEGDEGRAMYILVDGRAEVVKRLAGGDNTMLAELKAPSVFGEMSLIDHQPRSATVITTTDSVLFQINLAAFNELRSNYRPAAYKLLREIAPTICGRLRRVDERIGEFFRDPEKSLATLDSGFLDALAGKPGKGKEGL